MFGTVLMVLRNLGRPISKCILVFDKLREDVSGLDVESLHALQRKPGRNKQKIVSAYEYLQGHALFRVRVSTVYFHSSLAGSRSRASRPR